MNSNDISQSNKIIKKDEFIAATFNLRKDCFIDFGNRWKARKQYAAETIRKIGASVVGVQEMLPSMRQDVENMLKSYSVVGNGRSRDLSDEHSDIIVKNEDAEVDFTKTFWLSKYPEKSGTRAFYAMFPRICTVAEIHLVGINEKIRVFNTHFDHICGLARNFGAEIILRYINELQKKEAMPFILMGDLNAKPSASVIKYLRENRHEYKTFKLRDAMYEYNKEKEENSCRTLHFFKGSKKGLPIDYIFVSDDFKINNVYIDDSAYNGKYPSDHYPVVASLSL